MGKILAIDLGTTNSCIAVKGAYPNAGRVIADEITIIEDEEGNTTFPSVVAVSAPEEGDTRSFEERLVVGHLAKQRMKRVGAGDIPVVAFAKRYMGTDKRFPMGEGRNCPPEEISGIVLHHLIKIAERRLKDVVVAVRITVPAYFNSDQKRLTMKACETYANHLRRKEQERTGVTMPPVRVLDPLLEPIAAAHAYCARDAREQLRIMVYDLGGGTFDVTILEKSDDTFEIVRYDSGNAQRAAFGGDPLLGGYNFDKAIVDQLLQELQARYQLDLDENDPSDMCRINKLMQMAEDKKEEISRGNQKQTEFHEKNIFLDKSSSREAPEGRPVNLQNRLFTRSNFEELIKGHIDETIAECRRVLAKVEMRPNQLDKIVLVGGSSVIELITKSLQAEPRVRKNGDMAPATDAELAEASVEDIGGGFGKDVELFEPHLAVAIGAAYFADEAAREQYEYIELDVVAAEVFDEELLITGATKRPEVASIKVRRHDGEEQSQQVDEDRAFEITVLLIEESVNSLFIEAITSDGQILETIIKQVEHDQDTELSDSHREPPVFLTRSLYLQLADDELLVASEGSHLPCKFSYELETSHTGHELKVPLLEERHELRDLGFKLDDIKVHVGHPVNLEIQIEKSGDLNANLIIEINGEVHHHPVTVHFEPRPARDKQELRAQLLELEERYQAEVTENPATTANERMEFGGRVRKDLQTMNKELEKGTLDGLRVEQLAVEAKAKLDELRRARSWDPKFGEFEDKVNEVREMGTLGTQRTGLDLSADLAQITPIWQNAKHAYEKKDRKTWKNSFEELYGVAGRIAKLLADSMGIGEESPHELKDKLHGKLEDMRKQAKNSDRKQDVSTLLDKAEQALSDIDMKSGDARKELQGIDVEYLRPAADILAGKLGVYKEGQTGLRQRA